VAGGHDVLASAVDDLRHQRSLTVAAVLTTSFEDGPNGPLMPELRETFPGASFILRPGQINAWDNEEFVQAVEATGRRIC
jgi:hypothetical protein